MSDIAARQHGHLSLGTCRGNFFHGFFAVDRVWGLWQPLRYTSLCELIVVIRDWRVQEFLGHSFVRVRVPMASAFLIAAANQSERRVGLW
jgi:hypothetical protein